MKKLLYTCVSALFILTFCTTKGNSQTISSYYNFGGCFSTGDSILVAVSGYVTGDILDVYFGDGTSSTCSPYYTSGSEGDFGFSHNYASSGTYTVKVVVVTAAGADVDSATYINNFQFCEAIDLIAYTDVAGTCVYNDTVDGSFYFDPPVFQVDSAGFPVDTIISTYEDYYMALGPIGTIYTFKFIGGAYDYLPCSSVDSVNDTTSYAGVVQKYFGFDCNTSTTEFDNAVFADAGDVAVHNAWQVADVFSSQCVAAPLTLTVTYSPKYSIASVDIWPGTGTYSISGNILTVNLPSVSATSDQVVEINYNAVGTLVLGDTIHTQFQVSPITGDINPANNTEDFIDTIRTSYDPNNKSVQPEGNITAGTTLQYMVSFENTGNDTAHNIEIMDTLSANLDIKSIQQIAASAPVEMSLVPFSSQNIVEFSFPNINLLDSSHHGQCTGFVAFTINSKTGLATGTKIDNSAGIYFDDNTVVMTNNVENIIGTPTSVSVLSNAANVNIYPNPSTDEVTISIVNGSYNTATFTNELGQDVITKALNPQQTKMDVKILSAGIYYVTLRGESGVKVLKFEKR